MSKEPRRIRVLLVDDHSIMREGLQSMLKDSEEFEVVGQARDGVEAVSAASELSPDVIVMDVIMPGKDGVEACREIMESAPDTRVIMLTASTEEDAVIEAVAAGAIGYLQKVSGMDRLLSTLKLVAAGEMQVPPEVVRRVFARVRREAKLEEERDELTGREKEMLVSFCRGMSYHVIAEARGVKPVTVRNALYSIQSKLGLGTKQEIVVWPCGTDCWMTDHAGGLRENLAGPVRATPSPSGPTLSDRLLCGTLLSNNLTWLERTQSDHP